jgi:TPR repeat protein
MTATRHALYLFLALSVFASDHAAAADDGDVAFKLKDYGTAMKLLMPFAQRGDPVAETDVGMMYYGGLGVPLDRAEGVKWFMSSAKQGTLGGEVDMGIAYATGEGIRKDRLQAYMGSSVSCNGSSLPLGAYALASCSFAWRAELSDRSALVGARLDLILSRRSKRWKDN